MSAFQEQINLYYLSNGTLPIKENAEYIVSSEQDKKWDLQQQITTIEGKIDDSAFAVVDMGKLLGKEGYTNENKVGYTSKMDEKEDMYIVNTKSNNLYYVPGVDIEGVIYHTIATDAIEVGNIEDIKPRGNVTKVIAYEKNVYKQYDSGDLYGLGLKGNSLNVNDEKIDARTWKEFISPVANTKAVIPGYNTMYVIDNNDELWAWGSNDFNKLGFTDARKSNGTIFVPTKITDKKVSKVYEDRHNVFIIEKETNKLYVAGDNSYGQAGVGNTNAINGWAEVASHSTSKQIKKIIPGYYATLIWYEDNTFYYSGINSQGQLGYGTTSSYGSSFVRIWNSGGSILDSDIKDVLFSGVIITILKKDGTLVQAGYTGYDGGSGAGSLESGSSMTFRRFTTFADGSVDSMYSCRYGRVVKLKNGEIWGSPGDTGALGLGTNNPTTAYVKIPQPPSNIKEIYTTTNNVYYILENGEVYASGSSAGLGNGRNNVSDALTIQKLDIPPIETAYNIQDNYVLQTNGENFGTILLRGKDGKLYTTGNSVIIYKEENIQKDFVRVATNVKQFEGQGYVDNDNNLWISGNSLLLGIGETTGRYIPNFMRHPNTDFLGRIASIDKSKHGYYGIQVIDVDGNIYTTGQNFLPAGGGRLGRNVGTDIAENYGQALSGKTVKLASVGQDGTVVATTENKLYATGTNRSNSFTFTGSTNEFKEMNWDSSKVIKQVIMCGYGCYVLTENGEIYMSTYHWTENSGGAFSWTAGSFVRANIDNKVFTTIGSHQKILYGVTENGEVYHFGDIAPVKENVPTTEKIVDVAVGSGFVLYITETGKIFGKGDNSYGVLGIWEYADGPNAGQSIGENYISPGTTIVRCTHLEK